MLCDGVINDGHPALRAAISAQANAAQYIPIALLLLLLLEINQAHALLLHPLGLALLAGRFIHVRGIPTGNIPKRVRGMQLTFLTLLAAYKVSTQA